MTEEDRFSDLLKRYDDDIAGKLLAMQYWDYLKTEYWQIIREYLLCIKGRVCELCGENEVTQIHHANYKGREAGADHDYLENLYCLCKTCHRIIHDKSKIDISDGNHIQLGQININEFWAIFISEEKESHVKLKYIETKQSDYLKEQRFLDFVIANKHLVGSHFYRQFNPR